MYRPPKGIALNLVCMLDAVLGTSFPIFAFQDTYDTAMAKLKISLNSSVSSLEASGELFTSPVTESEEPLVNDVRAGNGHDALFNLPAGEYEYWFHVAGGTGKFTLSAHDRDTDRLLAQKDYDTKFGTTGKVLNFKVIP